MPFTNTLPLGWMVMTFIWKKTCHYVSSGYVFNNVMIYKATQPKCFIVLPWSNACSPTKLRLLFTMAVKSGLHNFNYSRFKIIEINRKLWHMKESTALCYKKCFVSSSTWKNAYVLWLPYEWTVQTVQSVILTLAAPNNPKVTDLRQVSLSVRPHWTSSPCTTNWVPVQSWTKNPTKLIHCSINIVCCNFK